MQHPPNHKMAHTVLPSTRAHYRGAAVPSLVPPLAPEQRDCHKARNPNHCPTPTSPSCTSRTPTDYNATSPPLAPKQRNRNKAGNPCHRRHRAHAHQAVSYQALLYAPLEKLCLPEVGELLRTETWMDGWMNEWMSG